jgi:hypothetical protein
LVIGDRPTADTARATIPLFPVPGSPTPRPRYPSGTGPRRRPADRCAPWRLARRPRRLPRPPAAVTYHQRPTAVHGSPLCVTSPPVCRLRSALRGLRLHFTPGLAHRWSDARLPPQAARSTGRVSQRTVSTPCVVLVRPRVINQSTANPTFAPTVHPRPPLLSCSRCPHSHAKHMSQRAIDAHAQPLQRR